MIIQITTKEPVSYTFQFTSLKREDIKSKLKELVAVRRQEINDRLQLITTNRQLRNLHKEWVIVGKRVDEHRRENNSRTFFLLFPLFFSQISRFESNMDNFEFEHRIDPESLSDFTFFC